MTATIPAYMSFGGPDTASEQDEFARPPASPFPLGVRLLAIAVIEQSWRDLHADPDVAREWKNGRDYCPDVESARAWFAGESDAAVDHFPFVWCCHVVRVEPDLLRARCLKYRPTQVQGRRHPRVEKEQR